MTVLIRTTQTALRALRRNITRSALTCVGIIIGIAAVIAMMEIGNGVTALNEKTIASLGLILLLFMIGLEMDLKKMTTAGRAIFVTALVQILGCIGLGFLFFRYTGLGQGWMEALYLAVALAMSSTVIIVKILHDKHELETLAGRITLGILVLQDFA